MLHLFYYCSIINVALLFDYLFTVPLTDYLCSNVGLFDWYKADLGFKAVQLWLIFALNAELGLIVADNFHLINWLKHNFIFSAEKLTIVD